MPLYEFMCEETGEIKEVLLSIKEADLKKIWCPVHAADFHEGGDLKYWHKAEKVWSKPGNIQIGKPTKVFVNNATGEVFSPFSEYDKPPKGYHEKELKNPIERSKFEKTQQARTDAQNQMTSQILDDMKSKTRNERHDNIKARMNSVQRETITNPDGKEEVVEFTLDHKDKQLLSKAMERSKKKPRKEKKTNVMLSVNHYNPSNMDQIK